MKNDPPSQPAVKGGHELSGRKILLGVCGGIAAYKSVELTRLLVKAGARVQVVMTLAAEKFITPLTFETITARHVFVEMFPPHGDLSPWHTEIATWPDVAVIAPATANHMARLSSGLADDLLSTIMLTLDRPRLICPSMNHRMWANPATQENLATLRRRGFRFVLPDEGQMARPGEAEGIGRLAEPAAIFNEVARILSTPQDLHGVRVLVTAGRTEESWDPVRVLTNRASGRMGFALAEEAHERGADVVLIHGPTDVIPPPGPRLRSVMTAAQMAAAVKQEFPSSRIMLMAAAVADYTFAAPAEHKIKKGGPIPEARLIPTEDILKSLADKKGDRIVVGFALETENLLENALKKLRDKHLDIVVANNPLAPGSGFAGETNQVIMIHRNGRVMELPLQSKREVAREILDAVISIYRHPEPEPEREPVDEEEPPVRVTPPDRRRDDKRVRPAPVVASPPPAPLPHPPADDTLFPDQPGSDGKKSRRSRRGGRRVQRARARKAGVLPGEKPTESGSAPSPAVEDVAVTTPEAAPVASKSPRRPRGKPRSKKP